MSDQPDYRLATKALHAGHTPDAETNARAVPIYQTSSYVFNSSEHAANLFALAEMGNIYTRIMNPTTDVLEQRLAAMDGGVGALAMASGTAAINLAILNLAQAGDNIVSTQYLYGGTYNMFNYTLKRMGINVKFVDSSNPANFAQAIDANTKAIFSESIGNPKNNVDDFEVIARIAHDNGLPFIVYNTVTTPALFKPFEHGADIICYSLTKFLGGHGTSIWGVVSEAGNFDWMGSGRFPRLINPVETYNGLQWYANFGEYAYCTALRAEQLRDVGACLSPFNAFLLLQGIETLPDLVRSVRIHEDHGLDLLGGATGDQDEECAQVAIDAVADDLN